ncbi:MAG: ankyrin repeat domain-containing protein [Endozoicomonadaceae bacterium]|nr:ankyrin repeat domain-containing protein [Endozoicomonadaceae bacterium]
MTLDTEGVSGEVDQELLYQEAMRAVKTQNSDRIVEFFNHNAEIDNMITTDMMKHVVTIGNLELVKLLHSRNVSLSAYDGVSILPAAEHGHIDIIRFHIANTKYSLHLGKLFDNAIGFDQLEVFNLLIQDESIPYYVSRLNAIARNGNVQMLNRYLEKHIIPDDNACDAINKAVHSGHHQLLPALLYIYDKKEANTFRLLPTFTAAMYHDQLECFKLLLDYGMPFERNHFSIINAGLKQASVSTVQYAFTLLTVDDINYIETDPSCYWFEYLSPKELDLWNSLKIHCELTNVFISAVPITSNNPVTNDINHY